MSNPSEALSYRVRGEDIDISDLIELTSTVSLPEVLRPELIVIMAGGLGERMMPLTKDIPKPMLPLAGVPILEHIIAQMISQGFHRFVFSVRHFAGQIRDHFGSGEKWGVDISYIEEPHRLGTGGSLAYLEERPQMPFIVANADLLTDLDYRKVLAFHDRDSAVTMCARKAEFQVPYGVLETHSDRVLSVTEKPTQSVTISAGMYAVSPELINLIEKGERVDMPDLIQRAISAGMTVRSMAVSDRWVDVGRREMFRRVVDNLAGQGDVE